MHSIRPKSIWPEKASIGAIRKAFQIQYFDSDKEVEEGHVAVDAINILERNGKPYSWNPIPAEFLNMFRIISWLQWSFSEAYSEKKVGGDFIGKYILYMEKILDKLWESIDGDEFEKWSRDYGSRWAKTQVALRGHHSEQYASIFLASEEGSGGQKFLSLEVEDWEEEAKLIVDSGFPGKDIFLIKHHFYRLTDAEKSQVLKEVEILLQNEQNGKFNSSCHTFTSPIFLF
jgi:hypothetical protein